MSIFIDSATQLHNYQNNVELEFSSDMTCDDVCDWLKQNNLSDKDIFHFRSKSKNYNSLSKYYTCC